MLFEGLEQNDLKRLVHPELHIDEFKSKLGRDEDICVVSFKVTGKEPATDLVNFIEKGYEWVVDADVSSGEMDDGDYIVFVECERNKDIPQNIITMMSDLMNVTGQKASHWRVRYYKDQTDHNLDVDSLKELIPQTPAEYDKRYGVNDKDLDKLKTAAGVNVTTKAPKNDTTESLRIAAGIL
jgi:hypothetical protein